MSSVLNNKKQLQIQPRPNSSQQDFYSENDRTASWYHGSFHLLCGNIGLGVLALSKTLQDLGWVIGISWFLIITAFAGYAYYCVMKCCYSKLQDSRLMTFIDLAKDTFNPKTIPLIRIMLASLQFGTMVTFQIAFSDNLYSIYRTFYSDSQNLMPELYFKLFAVIPQVILCFVKKLDQIRIVSFFGFLCTIVYLTITIYLSCTMTVSSSGGNASNDIWPQTPKNKSAFENITSLLTSAGAVIFSYSVACLTPNVLYTLKENVSRDNGEPGSYESLKAIKFFMLTNLIIYLFLMILGKVVFGDQLKAELLITIADNAQGDSDKILISIAQVCIIFHVIVAFQIFAFALFDTILEVYYSNIRRKILTNDLNFPSNDISWFKLLLGRLVIIFLTMGVSMALPFFGSIVALISAVFGIPICFTIPFVMYNNRMRYELEFSSTIIHKVVFYSIQLSFYTIAILITISSIVNLIE